MRSRPSSPDPRSSNLPHPLPGFNARTCRCTPCFSSAPPVGDGRIGFTMAFYVPPYIGPIHTQVDPCRVGNQLEEAHAFRKIERLNSKVEVARKSISVVCSIHLTFFLRDFELRQTRDDLENRARGARANARLLSNFDLDKQRQLHRARQLELAAERVGRLADHSVETEGSKIRPATARARREAGRLDRLTVDMCVVLRRHTEMSIQQILTSALPPIFKALRYHYASILPKRGLSDPATRFKRFIRRAQEAYRARGESVTTRDLLRGRDAVLSSLEGDPSSPYHTLPAKH
jgi:hypothetical protein